MKTEKNGDGGSMDRVGEQSVRSEEWLVTSFPYEAGEEMSIIFRKIEGEMKEDIQVQWAETQ